MKNYLHPEVLPQSCSGLFFMQLLVKILRNYAPDSNAAITYIPIPLVKAYILIEDSFLLEYNTITLKELSRRLGLSSRQTSRILYNRYGKNFLQKERKPGWLRQSLS